MNPCDAMPQDYQMYYDGCWMKHKRHGIGRIRVINGKMYFENEPGCDDPIRVNASTLTCWWPRAGAHNLEGGRQAVYIARRAMRNMRKSAIGGDHYFVKWGFAHHCNIMQALRDGPFLMSMEDGQALLKKGKTHGVAVSRDIILTDSEDSDTNIIIFRGEETGTWRNGCYTPLFSGHPLTGRVLRQLEERL